MFQDKKHLKLSYFISDDDKINTAAIKKALTAEVMLFIAEKLFVNNIWKFPSAWRELISQEGRERADLFDRVELSLRPDLSKERKPVRR